MKRVLLICGLGRLAASLVTAQLVITSFNNNGDLTWTNSLSGNATYRVEWAGSATGPWQKFDVLTNLTLLSATSNVVTVKVPTFYRVLWLDPPPHAGTWNYSGFDTDGTLIVTGRLTLSAQTQPITGRWSFVRVPDTTASWRHIAGEGEIEGIVTNSYVGLDLLPHIIDARFGLAGQLVGNTYAGQWSGWSGSGNFSAEKQSLPR